MKAKLGLSSTHYTVARLAESISSKSLRVDRRYQRSDRVWPDSARSLLVETVLLGYPMPKLIIRQTTDTKELTTLEEIVDGQQRTSALVDYFNGEYALSKGLDTEEYRGKKFSELPEEERISFVTYSVGADLLLGATNEQVIEVFRRMNSYTAPLNPEEQRHARWQGAFKFYIQDLSGFTQPVFEYLGVINEKGFIRLADAKLLTELSHALHFGIETTTKTSLNKLYSDFDKSYPDADRMRSILVNAISAISKIEVVRDSPLVKSYNFYSLCLAMIQAQHPLPVLDTSLEGLEGSLAAEEIVEANLGELSDYLQQGEGPDSFDELLKAASEKTNTKANRATRMRWFYKALTNQL